MIRFRLAAISMILALPLLLAAKPDELLEKLQKEADAIPGRHAFLFTELTDKGPVPLYASGEKDRYAIGSSFKLYILGALVDEVNQGKRRCEDVMPLYAQLVGPPSSEMASWPLGSPATIHTYALKMISVSDNTATDHLLSLVGREHVEQQMKTMGHANPAWNMPMLFTREMTMIRDKKAKDRLVRWTALDEAGRRKLLDEDIAKLHDYDALDFDTASYDLCEWFATPLDIARALSWLRLNAPEGKPSRLMLDVMTVEPKLICDRKTWPYVGFKGGSEDQILCGNWLLRHKNGKWYSFHTWFNNPAAKLNQGDAIKAMQSIFTLIDGAVK